MDHYHWAELGVCNGQGAKNQIFLPLGGVRGHLESRVLKIVFFAYLLIQSLCRSCLVGTLDSTVPCGHKVKVTSAKNLGSLGLRSKFTVQRIKLQNNCYNSSILSFFDFTLHLKKLVFCLKKFPWASRFLNLF
jgi:hypothetical protein